MNEFIFGLCAMYFTTLDFDMFTPRHPLTHIPQYFQSLEQAVLKEETEGLIRFLESFWIRFHPLEGEVTPRF